jgi:2-haloacid dehalogenase
VLGQARALSAAELIEVLEGRGIEGFSEGLKTDLSTVWRRLEPWPDAVSGLTRLRKRFVVCALSNGSMSQLISLAKHGGLPWDAVLSVELFRAYKPHPRVYLGGAELLQLAPAQVMMVAAHVYDLQAAKANGLRTAFVARPDEWGRGPARSSASLTSSMLWPAALTTWRPRSKRRPTRRATSP